LKRFDWERVLPSTWRNNVNNIFYVIGVLVVVGLLLAFLF
jgi:hypothetical protein